MTYEDLVKLGAKPGPEAAPEPAAGKGLTFEQLQALGAKPGPVDAAPPGFLSSGRAGPGSIDPDAKPVTELPTVGGPNVFLSHPALRTASERRANLDADASASHTDDPGVQAIMGTVMGAGAGNLIGQGARLAGLGARTTPVIQAAGAGGVANKVQGGDFTTGAALGAFGAAVPEVGRVIGNGARAFGEGAIERSAARSVESTAPVRAAIQKAATEIKANASKIAKHAVYGELLGHGGGYGHAMTGLAAAYDIGIPVARAGAVAADEGVASIARRFLGTAEAPSLASAAASNPQIAILQDALKTATPEQADIIKKSISGLVSKSAAMPPRLSLVPPEPSEKIAPSLAERVAESREALTRPETPPSAVPTPEPPAVKPPPPVVAESPVKPKWEPSKTDERFARKLKMPLDEYRAMMAKRSGFAPAVADIPAAPVDVLPEAAPAAPTPLWSPSADDHEYAKRLGLSTDAYRQLMIRRMSALASGRIR